MRNKTKGVDNMKYLNDVNYKDCVGKVCKSKSSGDFKILKYNDNKTVSLHFSYRYILIS